MGNDCSCAKENGICTCEKKMVPGAAINDGKGSPTSIQTDCACLKLN